MAVRPALSPQGFIKLNTGVSFVTESLRHFEVDERIYVEDLLWYICELDEEFPFLTSYNRKAIKGLLPAQRNSEAADFDEDE